MVSVLMGYGSRTSLPLPLRKKYVSLPYQPCAWPCDLIWPKGCYGQDMDRGLKWVSTCAPVVHQEKNMPLVATSGPSAWSSEWTHVRWLVPNPQQISWPAAWNRATWLNPASISQRVTLYTREHENKCLLWKATGFWNSLLCCITVTAVD